MPLQPVEVLFRAQGVDDVLKAFRTIRDAAQDAARAQAQASKGGFETYRTGARQAGDEAEKTGKRSEDAAKKAAAAWKEVQRQNAEALKAQSKAMAEYRSGVAQATDIFGNRIKLGGQDLGLRQMSSSKAFEMIMGKTAAQLLGLHGPAGQLVGAFTLMKGAVGGAIDALTRFGSYVVTDIIKPQLKLSISAAQIANTIGGGTKAADVSGTINALHEQNANFGLDEVTAVFKKASGKTKDLSKASEVARLALQAGNAYGADPNKLAEYIGDQRAKFGYMSHDAFAGFISRDLLAAKSAGGNLDEYLGAMRGVRNAGNAFGGASIQQQAATDATLTALVAGASKDGKSGIIAANGLTQLIEDVKKRPEVFGMSHAQAAAMDVNTFAESFIPHMIGKVKGNLRDPRYGMGDMGGIAGTVPLNKTSVQFLQALGLDRVYNETKGTPADKEKAVQDEVKRLTNLGSAQDALAQLQKDNANTQDAAGSKVNESLERLKASLLPAAGVILDRLIPAADALSKAFSSETFGKAVKIAVDALVKALGMAAWGILSIAEMIPGVKDKIDPKLKKEIAKGAGLDFLTGDSETKGGGTGMSENGIDDIDRKMYRSTGSGAKDLFNDAMIGLGVSSEDEVVGWNKKAAQDKYRGGIEAEAVMKSANDSSQSFSDLIRAAKKAAEALDKLDTKDPARTAKVQ